MGTDDFQLKRFRRGLRRTESRTDLVTCSLCLRVHRGSEWIEAEHVIRETRSFELEVPPRLHSAVCEVCAESIFSRRVAEEPQVEAA
jgi:NMD protein affecting ribosome stability and mRNA decay